MHTEIYLTNKINSVKGTITVKFQSNSRCTGQEKNMMVFKVKQIFTSALYENGNVCFLMYEVQVKLSTKYMWIS